GFCFFLNDPLQGVEWESVPCGYNACCVVAFDAENKLLVDFVQNRVARATEKPSEECHMKVLLHCLTIWPVRLFVIPGENHEVNQRNKRRSTGQESVALDQGGLIHPRNELAQTLVQNRVMLLQIIYVVVVTKLL